MIKLNKIILLILFISITNVSCQSNSNANDNFNMTALELKSAIENDADLLILDVRTPPELVGQHGQIEGVINIPVQVLHKRINELEEYKDKNIAIICRSGNRSVAATKLMQAKGFNAKNVLGGMINYNKIK